METETRNLAARLIAEGPGWQAGMVDAGGRYVTGIGPEPHCLAWTMRGHLVDVRSLADLAPPDLDHPATEGVVLRQLVERVGALDPVWCVDTSQNQAGGACVSVRRGPKSLGCWTGPTLGTALALALLEVGRG